MTDAARIELTVLGETLTLRSAAPPEYLRALAADLEARVAALHQGGVRDARQALIMAALELADELARTRQERSREVDEVTARLDALRAALEQLARPRDAQTT